MRRTVPPFFRLALAVTGSVLLPAQAATAGLFASPTGSGSACTQVRSDAAFIFRDAD